MSETSYSNIRFIVWIVLAVVVVGGIVVWIILHKSSLGPSVAQMPAANPVLEVPADRLPAVFPPNVPLEAGAAIISNFNSNATNGQVQATRSFQSRESADANFAIYNAFLTSKTGGWTIVSVENATGSSDKSIFAKGNGGWITITLNALPPQPWPATLVTITYVTNPSPVAPASAVVTSTQK